MVMLSLRELQRIFGTYFRSSGTGRNLHNFYKWYVINVVYIIYLRNGIY